jgi:hypothetical protein
LIYIKTFKKFKMKLYVMPIAVLLCGCVSATLDVESVCDSKEIAVPYASASVSALVGVRTASRSFDEDFSEVLGKVSDVGETSLTSYQFVLSGNVSFINHVRVTLVADKFPDMILSDINVASATDVINVPFNGDLNTLLPALSAGKVSVKVDISGVIPESDSTLSGKLCVGVSGKIKKSL